MLKHISHIGIAVKDLEAGIAFYEKLGLKLEGIEEVPSQKESCLLSLWRNKN